MGKRVGLIVIVFMLAVTGALAGLLTPAYDPRLKLVGYGYQLDGQPATAMVYELYGNFKPKTFFLLWQGKYVGKEWIWYDNGQLQVERSYADGLPDGVWKMWFADGKPKSLKTYARGQIDGEVWGWHANGQVSDYNFYVNGQEITHKSWIADGTPYYNYVYQDGHKVGTKGGEFCKRLEVIKK